MEPHPTREPTPREGAWFAPPRRVRWGLGWYPSFLFAVWIPYQALVWISGWFKRPVPDFVVVGMIATVAAYLLIGLFRTASESLARSRKSADRNFSDGLPNLREYSIEIVISENGKALGMDRGVLWFDDGLMNFSGAATSFLIAGEDVVDRKSPLGKVAYQKLAKEEFLLQRPGLFATVRLMPLAGLHRFAYRRALRNFLVERRPTVRNRQWPPAAPYGTTPVPRRPLVDSPEAIGAEAARTGSARGVVRRRNPL